MKFAEAAGASAIKEHYKKFSTQQGSEFLPPEEIVNSLGYQALQSGDTTKALEFFQMNIDMYPKSYNVWDSMAEGLMDKGDFKKAIEYYEKSLALNPNNENGKDMIKKMMEKK